MQIFSPDLVGAVAHKETGGAPEAPVIMHSHDNMTVLAQFTIDEQGNLLFKGAHVGGSLSNADVLARFSVVDNVLQFDGEPVDTVGQQFVNSAILEKFSVVDGKLLFDGNPVDTVGSVFDNDAVLRMFSQDGQGGLLFNGQPIEGGSGASLPNADDLKRLAVDENGQLTVDGAVVSGGSGAVSLTVTKLGSGTSVIQGVIGSDLRVKSLKAGQNVTLNVTSDEIEVNASLSGAVSSATTFKASDGYTNSSTISNNAETRIAGAEASTSESGLLFLARLGSDVKSSITDVALPITGSVTPNTALSSSLNGIATAFNNGRLTVPNGTTYTATSPASWFAGTVDWTVEFDLWRSGSVMGTMQNIVSGWNGSIAASSIWVIFNSSNTIAVRLANGASNYVEVVGSIAIADTDKHHVEINRSGGVVRIFIDGALAGSASVSASVNAGTGGFAIGGTPAGIDPFYGLLRNVKVYNYAKHTSAYTVPGYYADKVGAVNTVSMAGKLLSASFWKQITSLSVVSTETATAYLKWLMVDTNGYWAWDAINKVWVAADVANITSVGMTTEEVKAAFTNNPWNYRSDTVGFAVAFVTTDGASSPVLTSVTLSAVQSADKTAGHTIESATQTLAQRLLLKFLGMDVSDDGFRTVITGYTDSSKFTHKGDGLASVITQLVDSSGLVGGKAVDVSSGLADGDVLAYSLATDNFKPSAPALGASGNGLFRTLPFTLAAGEEKTVTHQLVRDGRVIYQADQVVSGASSDTPNRMNFSYDASTTDAVIDRILARSVAKLSAVHSSSALSTLANLPVASAGSCSYTVDDYIYWMPLVGANWTSQNAIYKAHISNPSAWTLIGDTTSMAWPVGGKVFRYKDTLFMWSSGYFHTADVSNPTKWTVAGKHATAPTYNSCAGAFLIGSKFVIAGGYIGGTSYTNNIYSIDLDRGFSSEWTLETNKLPSALGRATSYQYGDYLYIIGGETALDIAFSAKVYRASVSDPTTWTHIGNYAYACSVNGACVVKNGKVFVVGGHQQYNSLASVYMADASNPTSWTALTSLPATRFFTGMIDLWDGFIVAGGMQGSSVATAYATAYKYTLTPSIAQTVGNVQFNAVNLSLVQKIDSCTLVANIPVGTSVKSAFSIDGVWYSHDGSAVAERQDRASALAAASALTTTVANEYPVPGLTSMDVNKSELVVALQLVGTVSATPEVYAIKYVMKARDMYSPLLIASYGSSIGELALAHVQGDYSATNVKNKTSVPMSVVLKVYDGYGS